MSETTVKILRDSGSTFVGRWCLRYADTGKMCASGFGSMDEARREAERRGYTIVGKYAKP